VNRFVRAQDGDERVADPAARRPSVGLVDRLHGLQQAAGNRALSRLVASIPDRPASARAGMSKADDEPAASGAIPDHLPDETPAFEKGAGEEKEDAGQGGAAGGSRGAPGRAGGSDQGQLTIVPGAVDVNVSTPELGEETGRSRADAAAVGTVTNSFANPDTSPSPKSFGSESFKPGFKNATFAAADGKVTVNFTLDINCPYGTNGGTKKDVPSATDAVVTKDSYKQIVSDLTPALDEKSWRAPRSQYWSETICKRHERFHSTDDKAWSEGAGKQVVTSYLAGKAVSTATAKADIDTHLAAAVKAMSTANFQFYKGGATSYLSYAGEERAFGDGKQPYLDLAAAVKGQGERLEAAAAPAPSTPTPAPT
jgi:hypothetical protein